VLTEKRIIVKKTDGKRNRRRTKIV